MPGLLNELTIRATNVILRGDDATFVMALKRQSVVSRYYTQVVHRRERFSITVLGQLEHAKRHYAVALVGPGRPPLAGCELIKLILRQTNQARLRHATDDAAIRTGPRQRVVDLNGRDKIMSDGIDPWTGMRTPNWRSSFRSPYKGMIVVVKPSEKAEFLPTKQWEIPPVSRCGKDCFRLRR